MVQANALPKLSSNQVGIRVDMDKSWNGVEVDRETFGLE